MPPNATSRRGPFVMICGSSTSDLHPFTTVAIGDPILPLSLTMRARTDVLRPPSSWYQTASMPPVGSVRPSGWLKMVTFDFDSWIHLPALAGVCNAAGECAFAAAAPETAPCVGTTSATLVRSTQGTSFQRRLIGRPLPRRCAGARGHPERLTQYRGSARGWEPPERERSAREYIRSKRRKRTKNITA